MRHIPARNNEACFGLLGTVVALVGLSCSAGLPEGTLVDKLHYTKSVFYQSRNMNLVYELRQGDFDRDGEAEILALAGDGIRLLDLTGKEKAFTPYQVNELPYGVRAVATGTSGKFAYIANLPFQKKTVLLDDSGRIAWAADSKPWQSPSSSDFDGDGQQEIVVSATVGFQILRLDGKPIASVSDERYVLHHEVADLDGDGKPEILGQIRTDDRNVIVILSSEGRILRRVLTRDDYYRFAVARRTEGASLSIIVLSDDAEEVVVMDAGGTVLSRLNAPLATRLAHPHATPLGAESFVVLGDSTGSRHHHVVYVYAANDHLVYADSVADNATSLLALRTQPGEPRAFLVGARDSIRKYTESR